LEVSTKATLEDKDTNKDGLLTPREFWELDENREIMSDQDSDFGGLTRIAAVP